MEFSDNKKLEVMIKKFKVKGTPESERALTEMLRDARLLLPVSFSDNVYESVENATPGEPFNPGQVGFDILYLTGDDGTKAIPLFTSDEMMKKANYMHSTMSYHVSDLVEMFRQASDRYDVVFVNPYTEFELGMSLRQFIDVMCPQPGEEFMQFTQLILDLLKKHSVELDKNTVFFTRVDEDIFKENMVDGVYVPNIPLNVNTKKEFDEDMKYLYIIRMPESFKILYVGDMGAGNLLDVFIAPGSEFKFIEDIDEHTSVWECVNQLFYDE